MLEVRTILAKIDLMKTHEIVSKTILPTVDMEVGGRHVRVALFAIPVLLPGGSSQYANGALENIAEVAGLLHGPGCLGNSRQGFCLYPWLMSPAFVTAAIQPARYEALASRIAHDLLCNLEDGGPSTLTQSFTPGLNRGGGLAFLLGLICVDSDSGLTPSLLAPGVWSSGLGDEIAAAASVDSSDRMIAVSDVIEVLEPASLKEALTEGLLLSIDQTLLLEGKTPLVQMVDTDPDVVRLRVSCDKHVVSVMLQRSQVGDSFVLELCARLRALGRSHPAPANLKCRPSQAIWRH